LFEAKDGKLKEAFLNYIQKISKKVEIQKQPKKKIKCILIPSINSWNVFEGLTLEESNLVRKKCYYFIR